MSLAATCWTKSHSPPMAAILSTAARAMTRMRGLFLLAVLSAVLVPGAIQGLGLSAALKVVGLGPSWLTLTIGHLLWTLPFAAVVSLIGLSAVTRDKSAFGEVIAVQNYGAGDILEIRRGDGSTFLLPFTEAAVPEIDIAGGVIVVDPPRDAPGSEKPEA